MPTGMKEKVVNMKKVFLMMMLAAVLAGPSQAEEFSRVVLYQDMALLTLERPSSQGRLALECPPELILDSVRVTPARGVGIRSLSVEPKRVSAGRAGQLRDALAESRAVLEEKKRLQKTFERQIELIFQSAGVRESEAPFSRDRLQDALSFIDERVGELNRGHIRLGREIEELSVRVKDLEEQLAAVSRRQGYEIAVETDTDGPVTVSYAVSSGSWTPEYAVYADPARGEATIETRAVLRQATGGDWEARELLVATGRPGLGIQAPDLSPWYVGLPRYLPDIDMMKEKAGRMSALSESLDIEPKVRATATSYLVGSSQGVALPGDGTPKAVVLQKKTLQASLQRLTCPRMDSGVFLRAEALWSGSMPIVPGVYSAYVDGEFTGRGAMQPAGPGDSLIVDLGRDEGIGVERAQRSFHEKTLTGRDRTTYSYTVTLRNSRPHPVTITLKDQMPVSRDEAVKVELVESSPKAAPGDDGILSWQLDLAPFSEQTVSFAFSITGIPPLATGRF